MAKITRTEEQLTKDLEVAIRKLYKTLPGTPEEKNQILREKFEGVIDQLKSKDIQMVNGSKKTRPLQEDFVIDSETTAVQEETKNTFQEKETVVKARTLSIPEGTMKGEVLPKKQDDQVTTIVVEVHEKEKRDTDLIKTSEESVEPNLPEVQNRTLSIQQQIVKYGKNAMEVPEIASRVGVTSAGVSQRLKWLNIWSAAKIRKELKQPGAEKRSDNSWANLAGVDIEAIRRIRDEIRDEEVKDSESIETRGGQRKRTHISKSSSFRSRVSVSRSGKLQIVQEGDATELELEAASPIITYQAQKPEYPKKEQELAEELGIPVRLIKPIKSRLAVYSGIAAIAKEYKVSSKAVERILEIVKKEQYDRTHTEVQYKIKMLELRSTSKRGMKGEIETKVLEYRADTLVTEFTHFLTKEDYAFLAYAYAKARAYQKALDLGEQYLQLEAPSLSGLQQRINEVIQEELSARGEAEKIEELKFEGDGR